MGWAAFRVKRTKNGSELGETTVFVPQFYSQFDWPSKAYSVADLLSYPEFPIEASLLINSHLSESAKKAGFGNLIICDEYAGETWTFNNGSYIVFGAVDANNRQSVTYYLSNGNKYGGTLVSEWSSHDGGYVDWLPGLFGDKQECRLPSGAYSTKGYDANKITISSTTNKMPQSVRDLLFFNNSKPIYVTDDPYGDGGMSEPGGGTGSFDGTGDDISIPGVPTLSAVDAGFITLFNPTLGQMNNLASYMWSDLFDVNGWKKIFADPMGAILGLSIVPVAVPNGGTKEVKVGNIPTGVSMTVAASQYVTVDCGTLNVQEYWGAYLDYDPYTKAEIYLPYIGTHPLATDDIMNKPVHVVYHVDILSGACCALVQCGGAVLYSFVGQCASSIPITGDNWTNVINGAISIAGSIGSMVATGGASAPLAIGQIASTAVNTMKPSVEKSGAMGGTGGMLGVQTPYLILTRPRQALPRDQNVFIGYPSFITERLGDLSGYTEIESVHLENVPATEPELSEVESLLKSGVIF